MPGNCTSMQTLTDAHTRESTGRCKIAMRNTTESNGLPGELAEERAKKSSRVAARRERARLVPSQMRGSPESVQRSQSSDVASIRMHEYASNILECVK